MANDLTGRPWILDTASLTPVQQNGQQQYQTQIPGLGTLEVHTCEITGVVFRGYASGAASKVQLYDGVRNKLILELPGTAAGNPVSDTWFLPQRIKNLQLRTIDSGVVEVTVR